MSQLFKRMTSRVKSVDARTSAPFLSAKLGVCSVRVGQVVEILANDPRLDDVLPEWAAKVGHTYLGHGQTDGYEHLFMRRGR